MVWPFSRKKKVPKVPFPQGKSADDGALRFPEASSNEPENLKEAAGLEKPIEEPALPQKHSEEEHKSMPAPPVANEIPLYIKMDVYQRILGELEDLKLNLTDLSHANRSLSHSEYNEEANFDKLRRTMKSLHDRLLQVDKVLFKS